ncbi:hypothetical protein G5B00_15500 [Parapedobacter sp. SGR-10]|uniref:DUF6695 family protein n=1 Tax=Parapedobacter sp. SGR-10 TaxID=2710879 RepID=UPI0013D3616A|nr:DUF6695 family protein [Parapedobacter sp. SGR-10]NGF57924.1 hypothetical protein [Parapedobacter sp. SGR-10]
MELYTDIAIPISWPDMTALGDEKWMTVLKKIKVVKNLNFKIGHAAILLVERSSGTVSYFDFGRYLSPRGYGRARSADFDQRLTIRTKAICDSKGIANLKEILEELSAKEQATHGGGRLLFSIAREICYKKGMAYANEIVKKGPILYGALARNNNSCSRYVAQILAKSMRHKDNRIRNILYPECLKASPTSNVVNASSNKKIYCYDKNKLQEWKLNRWESLKFQISLLKENFCTKDATKLKDDSLPGLMQEPLPPASVPTSAQWMGGIGEGAWFNIRHSHDQVHEIFKFDITGKIEYIVQTKCVQHFDIKSPYLFTYDFGHHFYNILQNDHIYLFKSLALWTIEDTLTEKIYRKII